MVAALLGALLVSSQAKPIRFLGFCCFMTANLTWVVWCMAVNASLALLIMNVAFSGTSCLGLKTNYDKDTWTQLKLWACNLGFVRLP